MNKICVVLPTKDNWESLDNAIKTFFDSTNYWRTGNVRMIVIDCDTKDHQLKPLNSFAKAFPIEIIKAGPFKTNIPCINIGINASREDEDILLIHDDMKFFRLYKRDWLAELVNTPKNQIGMITYKGNIKVSGEEYLKYLRWIGSWFCYIPREVINRVGKIDEEFGIGEDIDYSYRVQNLGYMLGEVDYWFQHHQIRETPHSPQDTSIVKKASQYFKVKHGIK